MRRRVEAEPAIDASLASAAIPTFFGMPTLALTDDEHRALVPKLRVRD
jgi:hypothetical protein